MDFAGVMYQLNKAKEIECNELRRRVSFNNNESSRPRDGSRGCGIGAVFNTKPRINVPKYFRFQKIYIMYIFS